MAQSKGGSAPAKGAAQAIQNNIRASRMQRGATIALKSRTDQAADLRIR